MIYTDYWKKYYRLKKEMEDGKSRNWKELERLRELAEKQSEQIRANWQTLGVSA